MQGLFKKYEKLEKKKKILDFVGKTWINSSAFTLKMTVKTIF